MRTITTDAEKRHDNDHLADMAVSYKDAFDRLNIPTEDILDLYYFALGKKNDMLTFGTLHMVQAWPEFKKQKAEKTKVNQICPICNGQKEKRIGESLVKCWAC